MNQDLEKLTSLTQERLQTLCASVGRIEHELREFNARFTSLESLSVTARQDSRFNFEEIIRQQTSLDSLNERVSEIQKKLNLPDPRAPRLPLRD
jgi:chromosome segregation ATPase